MSDALCRQITACRDSLIEEHDCQAPPIDGHAYEDYLTYMQQLRHAIDSLNELLPQAERIYPS